jgi:class 3 adenylate cyclase
VSAAGAANEAALRRAIQRTASLVQLDGAVLAQLEQAVREAEDLELYLMNPYRFAKARGLPPEATVDAFVAAVRGGLLSFAWTMTCPGCGLFTTLMPRMRALVPQAYCALCDITHDAVLDRLVEVRFNVDPSVRRLTALESAPAEGAACGHGLDARGRFFLYRNAEATVCSVGRLLLSDLFIDALVVPPGGSAERRGPVGAAVRVVAISEDVGKNLSPPPGTLGALLRLESGSEIGDASLRLVRYLEEPLLRIESTLRSEAVLGLFDLAPFQVPGNSLMEGYAPARLGETVTGKVLLCNQIFRDLFATETLSAGIALQVEQVTLLFTDLKGSTALYDAIGDVRAFSLVSEHFKILLSAVRKHGGAVVKTIGDAVMGVFAEPQRAIEAALEMAAGLRAFNRQSGLPPLSLKIGVHCGPCIVVSSNERLDYFGQTVNVAARVQGLADGEQIVVSDACFTAPGVQERCTGLSRQSTVAVLKGVNEPIAVHTLSAH